MPHVFCKPQVAGSSPTIGSCYDIYPQPSVDAHSGAFR